MLAFMYAGQGAQKPGMGADLYETSETFKRAIDEASDILKENNSFDLKEMMFCGEAEEINKTSITQPLLAAFGAGITAILRDKKIKPDFVCGLSLGEYSALYSAGVINFNRLMKITSFRGKAMEEAGRGLDTKMCAILDLAPEVVENICNDASNITGKKVEVSNYNCTGQTVISGISDAVIKAEELAKIAGAKRCIELAVSGAFHTSFMKPAADKLNEFLKREEFNPPEFPIVFNAIGETVSDLNKDTLIELETRQIMSPVKMTQTIEFLAAKGVTDVIEIGPGHVLGGFIRKTAPAIKAVSIENVEDLEKI